MDMSLMDFFVIRLTCLLIKINISPIDIAKLTMHSKEAITSNRRILYEKVFGKKGTPKDWDSFILSL